MAFNVAFLSLFAMLPAPLIYGHLIDTTCDQWQFECGETTNCVLYDADRLRKILMYTTAGIMVVGVKKNSIFKFPKNFSFNTRKKFYRSCLM